MLFIIDGAHQCLDAGHDDIGVGAGTPCDGVIAPDKADVGGSAGGGAFVQTVLGVGLEVELHAGGALDGVCHSVQTAIAHRGDHLALTVQLQRDGGGDAAHLCKVGFQNIERLAAVESQAVPEGIVDMTGYFLSISCN